jgi:hypothetical protein
MASPGMPEDVMTITLNRVYQGQCSSDTHNPNVCVSFSTKLAKITVILKRKREWRKVDTQ